MGNYLFHEDTSEEGPETSKQEERAPAFDTEITRETRDDHSYELASNQCFKRESHSDHISIPNLTMDTLPENMRTYEMLNFIKGASNCVVRLCVSVTSERRRSGYNFLTPEQGHLNRYGTGWACLPFDCDETSVRIITARHVIYDDLEARNTEVTFFYDGPIERPTAVAKGKKVYIDNDDRDFVVLECDTPDEHLKKRLSNALTRLRQVRLSCDSFLNKAAYEMENTTALIISHPHGGFKRLTFGSCVNIEEFDVEFDVASGEKSVSKCVYKYDAATCPGSSGAPVIILGKPGVKYFWTPHCSTTKDGHGVSTNGLVIWRSSYKDDSSIR